MGLTRRDLVLLGSGAAVGAGGLLARNAWLARPRAGGPAIVSPRPTAQRYGHGVMPPNELGPLSLDQATRPPKADPNTGRTVRRIALQVVDQTVGVSVDRSFDAWTFGGTVPGPTLRANEGDTLEITLSNKTNHAHNLHFHGNHEIEADGWEPVPPGGESVYRLTAGPAGVHPYHCDFTPSEDHIANGLYGLLIVDPPRRREPADELMLVLCGFDLDGDGKSDLFGWNGPTGFYAKYPIKVETGRLVRAYVANFVTDVPLASFHLHAQMFDVFRNGTRPNPDERTDVLSLGPAERAVIEFRLPGRGRYMFHPHQRFLAEHGAMGWISAV